VPHFIERLANVEEYGRAVFPCFSRVVDVVCKAMALLNGGMGFAEAKLVFRNPVLGS
jgi:hypothetical protein